MGKNDKYNLYVKCEWNGEEWVECEPPEYIAYKIEEKSEDCGYLLKYVDTSESGCNGTDAYYIADEYESTDSGQTWSKTGNQGWGTLIQSASTVCGYAPCDTYIKYYLNLSEDTADTYVTIDGTITRGVLQGYIYYIEIGSCVTGLTGDMYVCPPPQSGREIMNAFRPDEWHSTTWGCRDNACIEYIRIPTSVKSIGEYTFYNMRSAIEYQGTMAQWNAINKSPNWNYGMLTNVIHCRDGEILL